VENGVLREEEDGAVDGDDDDVIDADVNGEWDCESEPEWRTRKTSCIVYELRRVAAPPPQPEVAKSTEVNHTRTPAHPRFVLCSAIKIVRYTRR
jgi:hypothetical protein